MAHCGPEIRGFRAESSDFVNIRYRNGYDPPNEAFYPLRWGVRGGGPILRSSATQLRGNTRIAV